MKRDHEIRWHHCRACGEEGLSVGSERCPHCGIRRPVMLCGRCGRVIREDDPWAIELCRTDEADTVEETLRFHDACYAPARRDLERRYPAPEGRLRFDARDTRSTIAPWRLYAGGMLLAAALVIAVVVVARTPRPSPLLSSPLWVESRPDTGTVAHRIRFDSAPWTPGIAVTVLFSLMAVGAGIAGILWGLGRRRALFFRHLSDRDLPPDR